MLLGATEAPCLCGRRDRGQGLSTKYLRRQSVCRDRADPRGAQAARMIERHRRIRSLETYENHSKAIGTRTEGPTFVSPAGKAWTLANLSRASSDYGDMFSGLRRLNSANRIAFGCQSAGDREAERRRGCFAGKPGSVEAAGMVGKLLRALPERVGNQREESTDQRQVNEQPTSLQGGLIPNTGPFASPRAPRGLYRFFNEFLELVIQHGGIQVTVGNEVVSVQNLSDCIMGECRILRKTRSRTDRGERSCARNASAMPRPLNRLTMPPAPQVRNSVPVPPKSL